MSGKKHWGACPAEWVHFDFLLGLTSDMLPVVSNPHAEISSHSKITTLGKTPSLYNSAGKVVGIVDWTSKQTTEAEVDRWATQSDYGICIQTRRLRALDIDVEGIESYDIRAAIGEFFGSWLPERRRKNSNKSLFAFIVEGDMGEGEIELCKRVMPVKGGMIEFLGNGQQFIAAGVHPSGVRYEWLDGVPMELPALTLERFEALWDMLEVQFATGKVSIARSRLATAPGLSGAQAANAPIDDDVSIHLEALSRGRDGEVYIECPFSEQHTTEGGGTDCVYFLKGTRGYEQGHFKCLHAHCAGRVDDDFIEALGINAAGFDVVELSAVEKVEAARAVAARGLDRVLSTNSDGKALATIENLHSVLMRPDLCGQYIRYDTFRDEIVWREFDKTIDHVNEHLQSKIDANASNKAVQHWKPFKDTDYTRIRIELATTGFLPIGRELVRDVIHNVAGLNRFDTAIEWLESLEWDGTERVADFMSKYMGAEENAYARAVSRYMWAAMAGRVLEPGCKADAAPIFVGEQYIGKSLAVASLVPDHRFFTEIRFDDQEDNLSRKMRGKLVAEFAELRGLYTKDLESIKAFVSRQYEEWVPKYMEFSTLYPRRLLFIGTSNKDEIFADETGNRRWFPVKVTVASIEAIQKDRLQLWAEGMSMFLERGVHHYYDKANSLAADARENFMITDIWEDHIARWLISEDIEGMKPENGEYVKIPDILHDVFSIDSRDMKKFDEMRVARILTKLGYEKRQKRINGIKCKVWIKNMVT